VKTDVLNLTLKKRKLKAKKCDKREGELLGTVAECLTKQNKGCIILQNMKRKTILHFFTLFAVAISNLCVGV
jgi:hypothetical protein